MDWVGDVIKALGGGIPAVLIVGLAVATWYFHRESRREARAHLETARMSIPLAASSQQAAQQVSAELRDALSVLRQIHSEQLVERARRDAHNDRTSGGRNDG